MKVAIDQLQSAEWTELPPMQSQREGGAAVAIHGSRILVVGGYHVEKKFLKSCVVFDVNKREWSDFPPMKSARMGCAAVYLEQHNAVVVVGGFQRGRKYLNTAEYLDLSTLHWHRLPPMQVSRAGCAAVTVLGKRVVVLGGWMDGETAVGTVEVLDFSAHQWHSLPEMGTPRAGCSAAAIGHRVLVLGGHTTSGRHRGCRATVEVLDLSNQKWSRMPSMREKRDASASCAIGNYVMILGGGETSTSPTNSVEILDVENEVWRDMPRMNFKRFGCAAATVGNKIVVLGGRGVDGRHLESVECLEIPEARAGSFVEENTDSVHPISDENGDMTSVSETISSMVEQDRNRINGTFDNAICQAKEFYQRTVETLEQQLRILDKEREKIQESLKRAQREKDETTAKTEKERKEALAELDNKRIQKSGNNHSTIISDSLSKNEVAENDEPPNELCCCITGDLMDDPVTAMDGHTYERTAIEAWYARFEASQSPTSPLTNEPLPSRRLIPSHNIRSQCKTWKEKLGIDTTIVADPLANLCSSGNGNNSENTNNMNRPSTPPRSHPVANGNRSAANDVGRSVRSLPDRRAGQNATNPRRRATSVRSKDRENSSQSRDGTPTNRRNRQPNSSSNPVSSNNRRNGSTTSNSSRGNSRPRSGSESVRSSGRRLSAT